ncbi:MAG: Rpn family recombination-promoting nuclease/putative transposase, partial [Bacteroidales bacterium]|nr:Rpn family recombination-promoting nuclease/putative transposase [Bacteroidales bacterium]
MASFWNPRNDLMFKKIFGESNKDILINFLNAVFEGVQEPIESVSLLPTHQNPEIASFRQTLVDVRCTDAKKNQFIVEMQHYGDPFFIRRACIYASRAYIEQIKKSEPDVDDCNSSSDEGKSKTKKDMYKDVNPVILLAILDEFPLIEGDEYISHNKILDIKTYVNNIKEFTYSFIRLDKFHKSFDESKSLLDKWCYFFKNAEITKGEEVEKIKESDPIVSKAYDVLNSSNYTQEEYEAYCHAEMCADAHESSVSSAIERGIAKGLAEGKAKGLAEGKAE